MRVFAKIQSIHFKFEKNDYKIIGYVRKSPSDVDPETRLKFLQKMVDNLLVAILFFSKSDQNITSRGVERIRFFLCFVYKL